MTSGDTGSLIQGASAKPVRAVALNEDARVEETHDEQVPHTGVAPDARRLVIRASAGTGKTFQLTNRYLSLLRSAPVDAILASTFTRKAAGEILERVLIRLAKAALDRTELNELANFLDGPPLHQKECRLLLQKFTRQLHRVRISTLDGFFARLAGTFAMELGLPPGWRIMDEIEADHLRDRAIEAVLREGPPQEMVQLMHLLDKGTASRSVHELISRKINQFYGIFLNSDTPAWSRFPKCTFLAAEQRTNLIDLLEAVPLADNRLRKPREDDVASMREGDWEVLLSKGLLPRVVRGETYFNKPIPDDLASLYRRIAEHVRAEIIEPWKHQTEATHLLLSDFHKVFERLKREFGGLQFEDVTRRLADAMSRRESSDFAFRLDGGIQHVLLDEFQDTAPAQWQVMRPFAQAACHDENATFFCVGDVKQAIYGWRGGEAAIFDAIEDELEGVTQQALNKSFRSSQVVIDTVNQIFKGIGRHDGLGEFVNTLQAWSRQFPTHETAKTSLPGFVRVMTGPVPEGLEPDGKKLGPLNDALWSFTAEYVRDRLREHPEGTIGVLTRKNVTVGRLIFELNKIGVDASEEGGNPLTDSAGVQLILSLMQLADHPGHTVARFHVAQSPLGPLVEFVDYEDSARAHALSHELRQRLVRGGYGPVVHELTASLAPVCSPRELRRLMQLSSLADTFDASNKTLRPWTICSVYRA